MKNWLRGTENAYEMCIDEIVKPQTVVAGANAEVTARYDIQLNNWDKSDRAASQMIMKPLDTKAFLV